MKGDILAFSFIIMYILLKSWTLIGNMALQIIRPMSGTCEAKTSLNDLS